LLDVRAALETLPDKQRRAAAEQQLASGASGKFVQSALQHAAALVAKLRDSSAYRWVDLGAVFAKMCTGRKAAGAAAAGASGGQRPAMASVRM
jgi:hypothetical protein